jgi:hypothetical protein
MPINCDLMSKVDPNREATLALLGAINHSLREKVVDLLISITVLKETQSLQRRTISQELCGINGEEIDPRAAFNLMKTASHPKKKARGQQPVKRYDRQL